MPYAIDVCHINVMMCVLRNVADYTAIHECTSQYSGMIMCNPEILGTEDTALISEVS